MEFKELIAKRRSVRKFTDREVPREVVDRILAEALTAPSSRNSRSTRFLVVDRHDLIARMAGMRDYGSAFMEGAPLAVVVCADLTRNPGASGDWWVMDASAASENLLLAAHALGLGAVWTGVYPRDERVEAVRRVLGLPADVVPLNLIPGGYPADNPAPKQKWNPANVRYNGWAE